MKMRLFWLVSLGLVITAAVIAATSPISRIVNDKSPKSVAEASAKSAGTLSTSAISQADEATVSKAISNGREMQRLYAELRAAKGAGHVPSADVYRSLSALRPPATHGRNGRNLDQGGETCANATVISTVPYTDFGTTTGYQDDYNPDCPYAGAPGNSPDVVYSYTPSADGSYHVSLCGSSYDTRLFVYAGVCSGDPIACNDDSPNCAPSSEIASVALTGGTTYYFVVDGYGDGAFGDYSFFLEETAPPPTGDVCGDPIVISSLPYSTVSQSTCAFTNDYSGSTCLNMADGGPDVIYSFTLTTATSVEIILIGYPGPAPLEQYVWPGILLSDHCPPDFNCIASANTMTVDGYTPLYLACNALQAGTYYVMVDNYPFMHPCYTYDLTIQTCAPCNVTSQPGDVEEIAEPFPVPGTYSINDPDGGCNNVAPHLPQYQNVTSGETVHGRTFCYTDSITGSLMSDTDWYRFVVTTPVTMTCTYRGESMLRVGLLQGPCPATMIQTGIQTTPCGSRSFTTTCLDPGEYYVRISKGGTLSGPDAQTYAYRASFVMTPCQLPLGRCCYAGTCTMDMHPACVALQGYWDGNLTCDTPCPVYPPNDNCQNAGTPATLPATFTGDNTNATNDCPREGDPQVWHVFTTTETQDVQVDFCGTENFHSFNPYLYSSCPCGVGVYLDAVDWGYCAPPTTFTGLWRNLPAGTWYLPVTMYNPNSIGPYTIHVTAVPNTPPVNDECANATPITLVPNGSVTVTGTTMNATASCTDICSENGFDYSSSGGDVFYSITLTDCRRIAMALGTSDMHIAVYQGLNMCCQTPAFLCNDDDAHFTALPPWDVPAQHPGNSCSYVAATLDPGVYLIRVAKYASQVGAYTLTVYDNGSCHCLPPVANDVTAFRNGNFVELRWSTDAASVSAGIYRIYTNTSDMPVGDPSWTLIEDNIVPTLGAHHLYYNAPFVGTDRIYYYVTGVCNDGLSPVLSKSKP